MVVTAVLSAGQAWAMQAKRTRWLRYPVVWAVATAVLVRVARWAFEWRAQDVRDGPVASTLEVIAALTTALALGVAALFAARDAREAREEPGPAAWRELAATLAGVHGAVVFFAGAVGLVVIVFVGLGQIH